MGLKLAIDKTPFWLDCPMGVRLLVQPPTTALLEAARTAGQREARELRSAREKIEEVGGVVSDMPDLKDDAIAFGVGFELLCKHLGVYLIKDWEGVFAEDDTPAKITPETVAALMKVEPIADAFYRRITLAARGIESEKKNYERGLSGSTAEAKSIA